MARMPELDVVIIGAGPAGMAAAVAASNHGARTLVVDSAPRIGGQFWRHAPAHARDLSPMHAGRAAYRRLAGEFTAALASGSLTYLPSTSVWQARSEGAGFALDLIAEQAPTEGSGLAVPAAVRCRALLVATGAYDRQLPIPGWDLPGVMAAGGIQAFIKSAGHAPGSRYVIAGTGPFLLPVAVNIQQAGGTVAAICEAAALRGWARHAHRAVQVPSKLAEGAGYATRLLAARTPYRTRTIITEILGDSRVEAVRTAGVDGSGRVRPGTERVITDIDGVGLGWGFTPQLDIPTQLGAATRVGADGSLIAGAQADGASSVPGLFLAGEVTGVGGAALAVLEGRRAGAAAATYVTGGAPESVPGRGAAARQRRFAEAMHAVHSVPAAWQTWVGDSCLVCRCEEVDAGQIRAGRTDLGATDHRAVKGVTRAGMGWCQGRVCGFAVAALASEGAPSAESLRLAARRPIARPIPLRRLTGAEEET